MSEILSEPLISSGPEMISNDPETEAVVIANVSMLQSSQFDGMLAQESVGGSGGFVQQDGRRVPCAGVNGYAVRESGVITEFGMERDVPPYIPGRMAHFILLVAFPLNRRAWIVECTSHEQEGLSPTARQRLELSITRYNQIAAAQEQRPSGAPTY